MTNKTNTHEKIREACEKYVTSNLEDHFAYDNAFVQAIANEYDRSPKTVRNILAMVRGDTKKPSEATEDVDRRLVISDLHYPFHLEPALQNVYQLLGKYDFEEIFLNGDILDCYSISSFERDPRKPLLADEIEGAKAIITKIRDMQPDAEIHFIEGNHEHRLSRLVSANPGLYGLQVLTWPRLLSLPSLGITYTGYKDHITTLGDIQITHGHIVRKHSAYSAKGHLLDGGYQNVIHGHTHRQGSYKLSGVSGTRRAYEIGGLYDKSQADYITNPNWVNGFCVIEGDEDHYQIQNIEVDSQSGAFIYSGTLYGGGGS